MVNKSRKYLNFSLLPGIFALAGPTMLEQFLQTLVQYIDTAMVGSLGHEATAAVGSTSTVNWLIGTTISAVGVGFLALISQAIGAGDFKRAKKASGQAMILTVLVGIIFTAIVLSLSRFVPVWMQVDKDIIDLAAKYFFIIYTPLFFRTATIILGTVLRSAGDTTTPMRVGIYVNIINVVLNFLLIYETRACTILGFTITMPGAGMGVIGAGIASAISVAVGGILIIIKVFTHPVISPRGTKIRLDFEILRPCMKVALPNMAQRFCTSMGYVFFASMINALGAIPTAAHTIANTVESAFYIPGYGMMTAAATLTGNAIGSKDDEKLKDTSHMIIFLEVVLMTISGGLLFTFAPFMTAIFTTSTEVITLGSTVLKMVALSEPFFGIAIVLEGMLQGAGETVKPFKYNVFAMWVVRIFGTFIFTRILGFGLVAAWGCMIGNNLLLCIMFARNYLKSFRRR